MSTRPDSASFTQGCRRRLVDWFSAVARDYPWRRTTDPYAILVSEMMLQQTRIATVLERGYYDRWMERFPDVRILAAAPESEVLRFWEGLGYYQRARQLHTTAKIVARDLDGVFPSDPDSLRMLPGLGPYAAAAVACFAFDAPVAVVDGNIERVLARFFLYDQPADKPAAKRFFQQTAAAIVPRKGARVFNSALMELGQRVCTPRAPLCVSCPLKRGCAARAENPESLPRKSPRRAQVDVVEHVLWVNRRGRLFLHQEQGRRRQGMWKLPALPHDPGTTLLHESRYTITHHRVRLCVHAPPPDWKASPATGQWQPLEGIEHLPMPAPYRKVVRALLAEARESSRASSSGEKGFGKRASKNGSSTGSKTSAGS